ncbi:MAG: caspase family protein [Promethearchaeota archaeon]
MIRINNRILSGRREVPLRALVLASLVAGMSVSIAMSAAVPSFDNDARKVEAGPGWGGPSVPVDSAPPADQPEGYAITSGVSNYPGTSNDLNYCDDDARDMADLCTGWFGIPDDHVTTLTDSAATSTSIASAISATAAQMDANDYLVFTFSGHGSSDYTTNQYTWNVQSPHNYPNNYDVYWHYSVSGASMMRVHFVKVDTEYNYDGVFIGDNDNRNEAYDLLTGYYTDVWSYWVSCDDIYVELYTDYSITDWGFQVDKVEALFWCEPTEFIPYDGLSGGVTGAEFNTMLAGVPGTVICVFDTCHSGGFSSILSQSGRYVVAACEGDEYSLEDASYQNGVFTSRYLSKWTMTNDANGDGALSFQEVFGPARSSTISRSSYLGMVHHPMEFDGTGGDVSLRPSVRIHGVTAGASTITVNFTHAGLGYGEFVAAFYDIDNETYTCQPVDQSLVPQAGYQQRAESVPAGTDVASIRVQARYQAFSSGFETEVYLWGANVSASLDSDSDGLVDSDEVGLSMNPWNPDTDGDNISDDDELTYGFDPLVNDSETDYDFDGIPTLYEIDNGLNPTVSNIGVDTDGDGADDPVEYTMGSDPNNVDTDGDGLQDGHECDIGTDPCESDTDGDGFDDGKEEKAGTDPLNAVNSPILYFVAALVVGVVIAVPNFVGARVSRKKRFPRKRPSSLRPASKSSIITEQRKKYYRPSSYSTGYSYPRRPSYSDPSRTSITPRAPVRVGNVQYIPLPLEIELILQSIPSYQREMVRADLSRQLIAGLLVCPLCGGSVYRGTCRMCKTTFKITRGV